MPLLTQQIINQRFTTYEAAQKLIDSARCTSEKDALRQIWALAREHHQPTGFSGDDFARAYQQYRHFKLTPEFRRCQMNTFEHDDFSELSE